MQDQIAGRRLAVASLDEGGQAARVTELQTADVKVEAAGALGEGHVHGRVQARDVSGVEVACDADVSGGCGVDAQGVGRGRADHEGSIRSRGGLHKPCFGDPFTARQI